MKKFKLILTGVILTSSLLVNAQTLNIRAASSIDGKIDCKWSRDRIVTSISGPCENFLPPKQISLGEPFSANGKNLRINIIQATKYTAETAKLTGANPALWYCVAADNQRDMPQPNSKGLSGTWLYIKNCQPNN